MNKKTTNLTRILHGNTEIIINELEDTGEVDSSLLENEKKKVAIRIDNDIYNFVVEHFGERGFSRFYHKAALELIEKMKKNKS